MRENHEIRSDNQIDSKVRVIFNDLIKAREHVNFALSTMNGYLDLSGAVVPD